MGKKIIAVNAGPRKGWNTDILIREAGAGAESKGAEVEYIDLFRLEKYTGCISCFGCKREPDLGRCVCRDGLADVLEKIRNCDGLIIGSPIYIMDLTASFRALFERLIFQYITYKKEVGSYSSKKIPVTLIVTGNMQEEGIRKFAESYKGSFERFIGPTEVLSCGNTLQVNNYEDFGWTMFDWDERRKRREDIFPSERENAYRLGAGMV